MQVARVHLRALYLWFSRATKLGCFDEGWLAALLFGGRDVKSGGRTEPDHDLVAAAARAVLASLREPMEQRQLPRAAMGALRMLEAALDGDVGRVNRPRG
jgi:hypothetical protein